MTVVLEKYRSADGTIANIQQEKFSDLFQLDVFQVFSNSGYALTVYRGNYTTRSSARRAMKRYGTEWKKEVG